MADTSVKRPSPDALLANANRESRGALKIFLGAAPGVGKTFEMLQQGRAQRLESVDVVIGVLETHGRIETEALAKGFETVPKKRVPYKGRVLAEMDLDAILQRRPALVLVDELAHTNAPGSRHPKRYMDVEELLAAGIDVYTTVNVQHLESLNDVVARITRIRVRETVPDRFVDTADEIELVDLTPDDLITRLRQGKVYVKTAAERALNHYFAPGNLAALRELALRKAAQHVDRELAGYMKANAVEGPWPAAERILVCVSENPSAAGLVRRARRMADEARAHWTALYVEGPRHLTLTEADRDRIADTLRQAQRLGGETLTIPGRNIADTILAYARDTNVTQILVGKPRSSIIGKWLSHSVTEMLIERSTDIGVHIVPSDAAVSAARSRRIRLPSPNSWHDYVVAVAGVALTVLLAWLLQSAIGFSNLTMLFLMPVLFSAVLQGLRPALLASVVSVLSYNFFFLPPLYTFTIGNPDNLIAFVGLLIAAIVGSHLTARVRAQADIATSRAKVAGELFVFAGKLAGVARLDDILWAAAYQMASMLKAGAVILVPDDKTGQPVIRGGYPPEDELDGQDIAAATWCWDHGKPAGRNSDTLPGARRLFLPMRTGSGLVGVTGILRNEKNALLSPDERRLLDALLDQTALAIERARLAERIDAARLEAEADKLRGAMLTSLSHDLRTPLASILGAATALRQYPDVHDAAQRDELLATIQDEANRLDRFVGNLLDISRLEAGALRHRREQVDLEDIASAVLRRTPAPARQRIETRIDHDIPPVIGDATLLEQALFNVVDNALKYGGNSTVVISAQRDGNHISLSVADGGSGIPVQDLERIFDKFHRAQTADYRTPGTGLGLAVARGFTEAMGGTLTASNLSTGGAAFTFAFPIQADSGEGGDH